MPRITFQRLFIALFALSTFIIPPVLAQPAPTATLDDSALTILNNINDLRRRENQVLLVPNDALNQVAATYLNDLLARPITSLGDTFLTRDKENLETLMGRAGYASFSDGYVADLVTLIVRDFDPSQIVTYWKDNARSDSSLSSRQMIRMGTSTLPIFSRFYREVGIATRKSDTNDRYYYVLVFGAQPGVLPVIITDRIARNVIADNVTSPDVILYINDENSHRNGDDDFLGGVQNMRISESPDEQDCPTGISPDWSGYRNAVLWTLSEGYGPKTIYVQLCDSSNPPRRLTVSTTVNYVQVVTETPAAKIQGTPTPDVLNIANATQTAAASATSYAPYLATVESILTATAAAPSP
ncbi:MAG: CAP domain-containing protein [Anaerolineae bacterium]